MIRWLRWMVVFGTLAAAATMTPARAQDANRAGLVIRFGDGRVELRCLRFSEPSISGLDLLARSGLQPVAEVGGLGSAVCSLAGQGCAYPAQSCFCQCQGAGCAYWTYFHLIGGAWQYSPIGAAGYQVEDGAVDGWSWGDGVAPPVYSLDQICAERPAGLPATPISASTDQPSPPPLIATDEPTAELPTPVVATTVEPARPAATEPAHEPTMRPTAASARSAMSEPDEAEPSQSADSPDLGGYVLLAMAALVLGGWLVTSRVRRS